MIRYTFYFKHDIGVTTYSTLGKEGELTTLLQKACDEENAPLRAVTRIDITYLDK